MTVPSDPAVLIIAYRRQENLQKILKICHANKIKKIYVSLDGPKNDSHSSLNDYLSIINIVDFHKNTKDFDVCLLKRPKNRGCAASVLSAIDWVFKFEKSAIILEDDCIPSDGFFDFSRASIPVIESSEEIWAACGSQFMPRGLISDEWFLSRYAIVWGWMTTRTKWALISRQMRLGKFKYNSNFSIQENVYWKEGASRAFMGLVDVWDTLFQQQLMSNNKFVIHSNSNLVSNIGNDQFATHTIDFTRELHLNLDSYCQPAELPKQQSIVDEWLRNDFYRIRLRHILSTKVTKFRDRFMGLSHTRSTLPYRWGLANLDHENNSM